ncbi:MAG: ROK family transcriptional regulator [Spirochaeta sp.]|nr:ROK family transcriptional regulator [Spirochaeta sp.]
MIKHPLRSNDIRESNEKLILNLIFQNGRTSQSQIVQQTGLKAPTVFRIFAKLEDDGLIQQCSDQQPPDAKKNSERKGRRPNYFCVEPSSGYAIGVDFSSLTASVIVVDFGNRVIYDKTVELQPRLNRDAVIDVLRVLIQTAITRSEIVQERIIGIGIAAPGVVDTVTGQVLEYERIEGLSGYSIGSFFAGLFDAPVFVHNNASVIAASAYHYGSAREENSLLALLVRSGVGGALVNHGSIFLNGNATALEVGRMVAGSDPDTTVESIVSEPALLALLREHFGVADWNEAQARLSNDEIAPVLSTARTVLAVALRNLYHVFHPEAILLISRFPLLTEFLGETARLTLPHCRIIPIVYDPVQACYGATDMVFKQYFRTTT